VLAQKRPVDVVARFRSIASAAAASITTNIPQAQLPALLDLADAHRPIRLRSVAFDPDLREPGTGRFDPADPDVAFMRRVVRAALAPPTTTDVPAPPSTAAPAPATTRPGTPAGPTATAVPAPETVSTACAARS
jgi:hypothetical protein